MTLDSATRPPFVAAATIRVGVSSWATAQFGLAVGALLHSELVVQGRKPHLAVGQEGLSHDDGQQGGHHHGNGQHGEEPSPTGSGAAPSNTAPRASRDDPERSAPGGRSFCATPRPAGRGGGGRAAGMPGGRGGSGGRRHQDSPPARSASGWVRTMARSRALSERGLAAISAGDALRAPRKTS